MDPRLHPGLNQPPRPMQDVRPPVAAAQPTAEVAAMGHEIKTELVEAIPLHQPGQADLADPQAAVSEPAAPQLATAESIPTQAPPQDDLEQILQAVNNRVGTPQSPAAKPKSQVVNKIISKIGSLKSTSPPFHKPVVPSLIVLAMAILLSGLAVMAYRHGGQAAPIGNQPGKVGTSYTAAASIQSAGGTLVRPSDLDDYSQELQTKLNVLNDSQDFAAQPLSDQTLGL